jgi:hypothetical protein
MKMTPVASIDWGELSLIPDSANDIGGGLVVEGEMVDVIVATTIGSAADVGASAFCGRGTMGNSGL